VSDREREVHRRVAHVLKCVLDVLRVQWNLVFIGLKLSCGFLFVGAIIAFVDNSQLLDNSW